MQARAGGAEPGRSNQHGEGTPADADEQQDYSQVGSVASPYTQARLAAAGPSDIPVELSEIEEAIAAESQQWPRLYKREDGTLGFDPGFLYLLLAPLPPEFILGNSLERFVQIVLLVGLAIVLTTAYQAVAAQNFNLALVLAVHWARNKLSPGRLLMIGWLGWFNTLWLYWVFFVGARIDDVVKRVSPQIRSVLWFLFVGWLIYLALGPIWAYPLPWLTFAPGNSALRGLGLMRVG